MFIAINFSHETDEKCQKIRINENINQDYPKYLESTRNSITQFRNFNSNLIRQRQEREVASLLQMSFLDPRTQKKNYIWYNRYRQQKHPQLTLQRYISNTNRKSLIEQETPSGTNDFRDQFNALTNNRIAVIAFGTLIRAHTHTRTARLDVKCHFKICNYNCTIAADVDGRQWHPENRTHATEPQPCARLSFFFFMWFFFSQSDECW